MSSALPFITYQTPCYEKIYHTITHQEGPTYSLSPVSTDACTCIDVLAKDIFLFMDEKWKDPQLNLMRDRLVTNIQDSISFKVRIGRPDGKFETIYNHELEQGLNEWKCQEEGQAKEAATRIRKAYYTTSHELQLDGLELSSVPPILTMLSHLKILVLSTNKLTIFPSESKFGKFSELKGLYIDNNRLTKFSTDIIGNQLITLNLENNHLEEVSLKDLPKLDFVSLSRNSLKNLPWEEFASFTDLTGLELGHNCLEEISPQLWELKKLKHLVLNNNDLSELPLGISMLQSLVHLNVANNEKLINNVTEMERIESELSDRDRPNECTPMVILH